MKAILVLRAGRCRYCRQALSAVETDFKHSLVFEFFQQRIAQVFEKQAFDQLMHGAAAAAVGQRDLRVSELVFSSPRPLYSFKKRRGAEYFRH